MAEVSFLPVAFRTSSRLTLFVSFIVFFVGFDPFRERIDHP